MAHPFEEELPPDRPCFTPRAQQTLAFSRKQAVQLHHTTISVEHLILGLLELNQGMAIDVLKRLQVDFGVLRAETLGLAAVLPSESGVGLPPCSPRLRKILDLAPKEATRLNHTYVGTEHLLLALLREAKWRPRTLPTSLNLKIHRVVAEIHKILWDLAGLP